MSWNYRVCVATIDAGVPGMEPQEYYGKPDTSEVHESSVGGDSVEEVRRTLALMYGALDKPVLDIDTLEEVEER